MSLKQSFCYPCFRVGDEPLGDLFRAAAEIGYAATELWSWSDDLPKIVAEARAAGLIVASITGHDSIEHGLNDDGQTERITAELKRSLDVAADLGIPGVICFSGGRKPGESDLYGLSRFVRNVRPLAAYAEERGVNLNLEVLNSRVDHPGYQCDTVDWAIAACEAVGSPRLKILFDVYHVAIMEGDLLRNLRRAAPYLGHVHTAGNPGRHELDDTQEIRYDAVARTLEEIGYAGYVGHELFARGDRRAALRSSFEAMRL